MKTIIRENIYSVLIY